MPSYKFTYFLDFRWSKCFVINPNSTKLSFVQDIQLIERAFELDYPILGNVGDILLWPSRLTFSATIIGVL